MSKFEWLQKCPPKVVKLLIEASLQSSTAANFDWCEIGAVKLSLGLCVCVNLRDDQITPRAMFAPVNRNNLDQNVHYNLDHEHSIDWKIVWLKRIDKEIGEASRKSQMWNIHSCGSRELIYRHFLFWIFEIWRLRAKVYSYRCNLQPVYFVNHDALRLAKSFNCK